MDWRQIADTKQSRAEKARTQKKEATPNVTERPPKQRRHTVYDPYVRVGKRCVAATYQDDCGENTRVLGKAQRTRDIRAASVRPSVGLLSGTKSAKA